MEIFAFVLYFVLVLSIGFIFFFKEKSKNGEKDYFLGGRQMGPWVTAMSAQASDMSAWLLMGLPGSVLAFGLGKAWIGIGLAIGTALNWIFVAKRLRKFSKAAGDSITLPQYLSNRFATGGKLLQIICAVIFLVFFTVYVASGFVAGADVFTSLFPKLDRTLAMTIFAVIILLYTFLGGFKAVCWTDFFQGMLMLIALLAVPIAIMAFSKTDASLLSTVYSYTDADGSVVDAVFKSSLFSASPQEIISGLAWGLGYFGMPHILVRFMSIKKASMVKKSATIAIIWVVITLGASILMAYLTRMIIGNEIAKDLLTDGNQKLVFITLARKLFPAFIAGILMAAIIAASMSTADSQLLVASSSFTSDIYRPIIRKKASDKEVLWVGRIVVLVVAVIAYLIASSKSSGAQAIMNMVENAWAGFGSAFGPVIILSLFWRRLTYKGALAGVIGGAVVDVAWMFCFNKGAASLICDTGIYELAPVFLFGMIITIVVTLIDRAPAKETVDVYDRAIAMSDDDM